MPNHTLTNAFLIAIFVASARTWESRLPGFRTDFKRHIDELYYATPIDQLALRNALGALSDALTD